ncbi:hypothetical protein A2U01_0095610, partial [Trifolium medium]|nr:hypothetical protein [Trifolium medium]
SWYRDESQWVDYCAIERGTPLINQYFRYVVLGYCNRNE